MFLSLKSSVVQSLRSLCKVVGPCPKSVLMASATSVSSSSEFAILFLKFSIDKIDKQFVREEGHVFIIVVFIKYKVRSSG